MNQARYELSTGSPDVPVMSKDATVFNIASPEYICYMLRNWKPRIIWLMENGREGDVKSF